MDIRSLLRWHYRFGEFHGPSARRIEVLWLIIGVAQIALMLRDIWLIICILLSTDLSRICNIQFRSNFRILINGVMERISPADLIFCINFIKTNGGWHLFLLIVRLGVVNVLLIHSVDTQSCSCLLHFWRHNSSILTAFIQRRYHIEVIERCMVHVWWRSLRLHWNVKFWVSYVHFHDVLIFTEWVVDLDPAIFRTQYHAFCLMVRNKIIWRQILRSFLTEDILTLWMELLDVTLAVFLMHITLIIYRSYRIIYMQLSNTGQS